MPYADLCRPVKGRRQAGNSPSGTILFELDSLYDLDIGGRLLDAPERHSQAGAFVRAQG